MRLITLLAVVLSALFWFASVSEATNCDEQLRQLQTTGNDHNTPESRTYGAVAKFDCRKLDRQVAMLTDLPLNSDAALISFAEAFYSRKKLTTREETQDWLRGTRLERRYQEYLKKRLQYYQSTDSLIVSGKVKEKSLENIKTIFIKIELHQEGFSTTRFFIAKGDIHNGIQIFSKRSPYTSTKHSYLSGATSSFLGNPPPHPSYGSYYSLVVPRVTAKLRLEKMASHSNDSFVRGAQLIAKLVENKVDSRLGELPPRQEPKPARQHRHVEPHDDFANRHCDLLPYDTPLSGRFKVTSKKGLNFRNYPSTLHRKSKKHTQLHLNDGDLIIVLGTSYQPDDNKCKNWACINHPTKGQRGWVCKNLIRQLY